MTAAIDVALWDLAGRRANAPLWILLGGAQDCVRLYNTHVGWMEPLLKAPLIRRDGYGVPPDAPGHGIEFDPEALERFAVRERDLQVGR